MAFSPSSMRRPAFIPADHDLSHEEEEQVRLRTGGILAVLDPALTPLAAEDYDGGPGGGRRVGEAHPTTKNANEVSSANGARQRTRYSKHI